MLNNTYLGLNADQIAEYGLFETLGASPDLKTAASKLALLGKLRAYINGRLIDKGVLILHSDSTFIDYGVEVGAGTVIYQNNILSGNTVLGGQCVLYPGNALHGCTVGERVTLRACTAEDAAFGDDTVVGPYAYVRPGTRVGSHCRVGDFVELKNAVVGDGTKISHLTYVGDADVGRNVNLGCGTVFVNYNGKQKSRTSVGDDAFIGCNCNLIAPVTLGKGVYVAAGTTVTQDLSDDAFCIGRCRQTVKEGGAVKYRKH